MIPVEVYKKTVRVGGKRREFKANQSWREIGDRKIFFRSNWEYQYALWLQKLKEANAIYDWEHEPQTFWFNEIKRGTRSYLPDFKVINPDGSHHWVEVKGYMDKKSQTKIRRFRKYYPTEQLVVVDSEWFKKR
jgi:Protein of unknown function (DUF1064)